MEMSSSNQSAAHPNQEPDICDPKPEKWDRFAEWIHCFCVVTFDLELGQAMETIYPPHVKLSDQEKMNVCYLAFPDSNSSCIGDTQFHVRLRSTTPSHGCADITNGVAKHGNRPNYEAQLRPEHIKFNQVCLPQQKADGGHLWGFVYFRQIKDMSLKRGYFQKSFVLLTRLPFINLFYEICTITAPAFFEHGNKYLENLCDNICGWPSLEAGRELRLNILGNCFQICIPKLSNKFYQKLTPNESPSPVPDEIPSSAKKENQTPLDSQINEKESTSVMPPAPLREIRHQRLHILSSIYEIDIFKSLHKVLSHINVLWELVLTGEPIVVLGNTPTECASMVQSIQSLISPLTFNSEVRPYFTIHDSEFKEFTQQAQGPPSIILGVTNPFFVKTLQHWPHILRLDHNQSTLTTQYKAFLQKDKSMIKKIALGMKTKRPAAVQSALLRRYLLELTQSFMIPLERYMASLMPLQKNISPFKSPPNPNPFRQDEFLATLEYAGPELTFKTAKGDWEGLYKRFFRSTNFRAWFDQRYDNLTQTLETLQIQALCDSDLKKWSQGKHEVEIVDMILKLKQKLKFYADSEENEVTTTVVAGSSNQHETKDQLMRHLQDMKNLLPDDLQSILQTKSYDE